MEKRWMWFETSFRTLKEDLREFLKGHGIKYELSGCGMGWHFEVLCSVEDEKLIDDFLNMNTIQEVRA